MPDTRKHRGPHPADADLFNQASWPGLQQAVDDLSWLMTRDYPPASSLKLVGDRFHLTERQRIAVMRSSCSDQAARNRSEKRISTHNIAGEHVDIDGFNLLTTIEAALAGGVILSCRDGCCRDMASMHGSYRKVEETLTAIRLIGITLAKHGISSCRWLFDRPVSNSARICQTVRDCAEEYAWNWAAELHPNPDTHLIESSAVVISADSQVLDGSRRWTNFARHVIEQHIPHANVVPMTRDPG